MYGVAGERRLTELELDWLPGYEDSSPVRTGNGAHSQFQLDVYGELLDVLVAGHARRHAAERELVVARPAAPRGARDLLARTRRRASGRSAGRRKHFTHSKVLCWVAFDRAIAMVEHAGYEGPVDRWRTDPRRDPRRGRARRVTTRSCGAFTQCFGSTDLDASVLMIPLVGFLPGDDPRVRSTIAVIRRDLTLDGLVLRYDPTDQRRRRHRRTRGRRSCRAASGWSKRSRSRVEHADALALFERLLGLANDLGLFSEEYDPTARPVPRQLPAGVHAPRDWSRPRTRSPRSGRRTGVAAATRVADVARRCRGGGDRRRIALT